MLHRYVLQPLSPWGTPLRGDTLYGLILYRIGEDEGVQALRQTLDACRQGRSPFVVSSAMPENMLFSPLLPPAPRETFRQWVEQGAFRDQEGCTLSLGKALGWYKKFRKKSYLEFKFWQKHAKALSVRQLFAEFCSAYRENDGASQDKKAGVEPHVTIDRHTGGALEGGLFADTLSYFREGAKLHLYAETDVPDTLLRYLQRIGDIGFGKNSSTGKGRFAAEKDGNFSPASLPSTGTHQLLLSPCATNDMRRLQGCYAVDVKRGKATPHLSGGNPFKNPFLCIREGALLSSLPLGPYVLDGVHEHPDIAQVVQPLCLSCTLKEDSHA